MGDLVDVVADAAQLGEHLRRERGHVILGRTRRPSRGQSGEASIEAGGDHRRHRHARIGGGSGEFVAYVQRQAKGHDLRFSRLGSFLWSRHHASQEWGAGRRVSRAS